MKTAKTCKLMVQWHKHREMVTPAGFEPATCPLGGGCSIQLSHGAVGEAIANSHYHHKLHAARARAIVSLCGTG